MPGSVSTIRSAVRVLQVLAALNVEHPAGSAALARRLGMSPATTYRFLETLVDAGYATKDPATGRYSPSHQVRALSCGFEDEHWLAQAARPVIESLGRELVWPIAIATLSGPAMLLRESTDMQSPLAINRFAPGRRVSLVGTATGRAYLAFCGEEQRETLLDILSTSTDTEDAAVADRERLRRELEQIRAAGYAVHRRAQRVTHQCAIAVPVLGNGRVVATLSIRYADTAVRRADAMKRFLPRLRAAAEDIGRAFVVSVVSGGDPR